MGQEKQSIFKNLFNKKNKLSKEENNLQPKLSKGIYVYPFILPDPSSIPTEDDERTHSGKFKGAIDFIVEVGTSVIAADDGIVVKVETGHTEYGDDLKYKDELNYITIYHPKTEEYSQYCHLGKTYVIQYDEVFQGDQIAKTDLNGFMNKPHLHFFVCEKTPDGKDFVGLIPNIKPFSL